MSEYESAYAAAAARSAAIHENNVRHAMNCPRCGEMAPAYGSGPPDNFRCRCGAGWHRSDFWTPDEAREYFRGKWIEIHGPELADEAVAWHDARERGDYGAKGPDCHCAYCERQARDLAAAKAARGEP